MLILTKPNSGKAERSISDWSILRDEEIFVGIDADTVIARDAISRLVPHFLNPKVGAVAGNAKVGNRVNLWTRWQALEYITSQNFERRALNTMGAVSVVPGAIGAWRVSAVREAGGFHTDTVAEDADLTMALLQLRISRGIRRPGAGLHRSAGQCEWPDAPAIPLVVRNTAGGVETSRRLCPRRRAGLDCAAQHRHLPDAAAAGLAVDRHHVCRGRDLVFHPEIFPSGVHRSGSFQRLIVFFVAFLVIDFLASAIAFALERRQPEAPEDPWLLSQVWLQRFAYRQLFSIVLLKTLKRAAEGRRFAWDKLERTAAMSYQPAETTNR